MKELYFLDRDLVVTAGPIDTYQSLVWRECYFEPGSYTLVLPLTRTTVQAAFASAYLQVSGRPGLGRIERIRCSDGEGGGTVTVSGRMAESLLYDRIIPRGTRVRGELCAVIEALVSDNAGATASDRAVAHLTVIPAAPLTEDDGSVITVSDTPGGSVLGEWLYETLGAHGASYRIVPGENGDLVFSVFRGLDRTQAQEENSFAVFSASLSSSGDFDLLSDTADARNFAFIAGEGVGDDRTVVTLDLRADPDEPLRELYVDARDLRSDDGTGEALTEEEYRELLLARGRQRLSEHTPVLRIDGGAASYTVEADALTAETVTSPPWGEELAPIGAAYGSSMLCGVHYALGDLCDVASEPLGLLRPERVTEVTYTCEGSHIRIETRLGTTYPDLRALIRAAARD